MTRRPAELNLSKEESDCAAGRQSPFSLAPFNAYQKREQSDSYDL